MRARNSGGPRLLTAAAVGGLALLAAGGGYFFGSSKGPFGSGPGSGPLADLQAGGLQALIPGLIPIARADVGRGEYQFLPCRKEMWVVNRANGKFVHYHFFDTDMGTVERSRIAAIDQAVFPLRDTDFLLSDRNLNSFLWVVNRATGDFQMWRANRDGTLTTDERHVPAGEALRGEPSEPRKARTDRSSTPGSRRPAPASGPPPEAFPERKAPVKKVEPVQKTSKGS